MKMTSIQVAAPVSSVDDAARIIAAGAHELYCGAMFQDWFELFGEADLISRRQGRMSHITSPDELYRIARFASDHHCKIALTLNARYSQLQQEKVLDLIRRWEDAGGTHLLIGEPALLFTLKRLNTSLKRHLSIMAGVFNSSAVRFFKQLGVSRMVLPRELRPEEVHALIKEEKEMEFEMLAMLQKCRFIDGMCGFYHGIHLPPDRPALFDYSPDAGVIPNAASAIDPEYEGHGCLLDYQTRNGKVSHLKVSDDPTPHCAACSLPELYEAGVRFFKIAGRGYPVDQIARIVGFVSASIEIWRQSDSMEAGRAKIKDLYTGWFGKPCDNRTCYYVGASFSAKARKKPSPDLQDI